MVNRWALGAQGGMFVALGALLLGAGPLWAQAPIPPVALDRASTVWVLGSAGLVMLMVPALALFYGGMVRRKNVLGTMMHSFAALAIVGVEWVVLGYAMTFGSDHGGLIGWDSGKFMLQGIMPGTLISPGGAAIPEYAFVLFQGMFAIIAPALIAGAFAERVKFSSYAVFALLWSILIYNPLAHWVWGGGWLQKLGALDFAGGTVIHISAGVSALVMALYLGKRLGYPSRVLQPNSLVLTLFGAGVLWFGWFGFNGGSSCSANSTAALAVMTTQIAAAAGALSWMLAEWLKHGRPTSMGIASGLVAGLATVTQAAGYISPMGALIIGLVAGVACFQCVLLKGKLGYDDSLDAFGVHGVGGFLGALMTGLLCSRAFNPDGADAGMRQFGIQAVAALSAAAYGGIGTLVLTWSIDKVMGFRLGESDEIEGLDSAVHGEQGWELEGRPAMGIPGSQAVEEHGARQREMASV